MTGAVWACSGWFETWQEMLSSFDGFPVRLLACCRGRMALRVRHAGCACGGASTHAQNHESLLQRWSDSYQPPPEGGQLEAHPQTSMRQRVPETLQVTSLQHDRHEMQGTIQVC